MGACLFFVSKNFPRKKFYLVLLHKRKLVDEKVYSKDNVWGYLKIFVIRQLIYGRCSISADSWCRNHLLGIKLSIEKVVLGLDDDKNYIKTVYSSI